MSWDLVRKGCCTTGTNTDYQVDPHSKVAITLPAVYLEGQEAGQGGGSRSLTSPHVDKGNSQEVLYVVNT